MRNRLALMFAILALMVIPLWMAPHHAEQQRITAPSPPPLESYSHAPAAPFDRSDYVIKINQMSSFYDKPGEFGYAIHAEQVRFRSSLLRAHRDSRMVGRPCTRTQSKRHMSCSAEGSATSLATAGSRRRGRTLRACQRAYRTRSSTRDPRRSTSPPCFQQTARLHRGGADPR